MRGFRWSWSCCCWVVSEVRERLCLRTPLASLLWRAFGGAAWWFFNLFAVRSCALGRVLSVCFALWFGASSEEWETVRGMREGYGNGNGKKSSPGMGFQASFTVRIERNSEHLALFVPHFDRERYVWETAWFSLREHTHNVECPSAKRDPPCYLPSGSLGHGIYIFLSLYASPLCSSQHSSQSVEYSPHRHQSTRPSSTEKGPAAPEENRGDGGNYLAFQTFWVSNGSKWSFAKRRWLAFFGLGWVLAGRYRKGVSLVDLLWRRKGKDKTFAESRLWIIAKTGRRVS